MESRPGLTERGGPGDPGAERSGRVESPPADGAGSGSHDQLIGPEFGPAPPGGAGQSEDGSGEMQNVLVELRVTRTRGVGPPLQMAAAAGLPGLDLDTGYTPIPVAAAPDGAATRSVAAEETVIVRGRIQKDRIPELEAQPGVVRVLVDTPIAPFAVAEHDRQGTLVMPLLGAGPCPVGACDCSPGAAKGTIGDVARYLGVDQLWAAGIKGRGIVIGIVDGGVTALGRSARPGESPEIPRVVDGWPATDWGTTAQAWARHGNMTATDALGMAPEAEIYDIRISDGSAISNALAGYQWAIDRHRVDGTPHILSNSWGVYQESWDPVYARDPSHPFTRKVVEAISEGILVLFAAGNCGGACPTARCGSDSGPGRSIWGANGHPDVMTVGAVNKDEQLVGYSSQGPAALDAHKPDFCSVTHFRGYFASDSGTSAATPIAAGVVALLKQGVPALTQHQAKAAFVDTARDIGPAGWDQHSGAGIIRAKAAYDRLADRHDGAPVHDWELLGGTCILAPAAAAVPGGPLHTFAVGIDHAIYRKSWHGAAWSGWERIGGTCVADPAAVAILPGAIDIFAIGPSGELFRRRQGGLPSEGWENLAGACTRGVAAVSLAAGRLDCFTVGLNSRLYHKRWNGTAWSRWRGLGGTFGSPPAAACSAPNRIDVFAIGLDSAIYHISSNGSGWSEWEPLGGSCIYGVAATSGPGGRIDCFTIGTDRALYRKSWDGSSWSGWTSLGGTWVSAPAAVASSSTRIDIFVIGTDSALYHRALTE